MSKTPELMKTGRLGWRILWKNDGLDYPEILERFRRGELTGKPLSTGSAYRKVYRLEAEGRALVVKHDLEVDPRLEKKIWELLAGSPYSRLIRFTNQAIGKGCPVAQDVFLVAERMVKGRCQEAWLIAEFVEGTSFIEQYNADGTPAQASEERAWVPAMAETLGILHDYGLASNDFHPGNFIRTGGQGLKIIDLAVDGPLIVCQVNDALALRHFYKITPPMRSPARRALYAVMLSLRRLKKLSRKIRGRKLGPS